VFGRLSKAAAKCDSLPREGGREGFDPLFERKTPPRHCSFQPHPSPRRELNKLPNTYGADTNKGWK